MTVFAAVAGHVSHDVVSPWVGLGVYLAGWVIAARIVYWLPDDKFPGAGEDRLVAALVALIWPVLAAVAIAVGVLRLPTIGCGSRARRLEPERQAAGTAGWERQKRAARIAELEAENERLRGDAP